MESEETNIYTSLKSQGEEGLFVCFSVSLVFFYAARDAVLKSGFSRNNNDQVVRDSVCGASKASARVQASWRSGVRFLPRR